MQFLLYYSFIIFNLIQVVCTKSEFSCHLKLLLEIYTPFVLKNYDWWFEWKILVIAKPTVFAEYNRKSPNGAIGQ